ncbi:MAG: HIT domain-containing protein [Desulfurococcales archaeon]|nr:HIT domain-containing protein [Desulfurococcales archaeon]
MARTGKCIFCKILHGEAPAYFIYRGHGIAVILDIMPVEKGHLLVLTEDHYENLFDAPPCSVAKAYAAAAALARIYNALGAPGVNIIQNNGKASGQEVFHFHIHVIPRWRGGGFRGLLSRGRHRLTTEEALSVIEMLRPHLDLVDSYLSQINC